MSDLSGLAGFGPQQLEEMSRWQQASQAAQQYGITTSPGEFITGSTIWQGKRVFWSNLGGIFMPEEGSQFLGSYLGLPDEARQGDRGGFGSTAFRPNAQGGYTLVSNNFESYDFFPSTGTAAPAPAQPSAQPATSPAPDTSDETKAIFQQLSRRMGEFGLGELFSVTNDGTPQGWLWDQIVAGVDTPEELDVALESTPQFQQRFRVIFEQRKRQAENPGMHVMTPAEVLDYEQRAQELFSYYGLPAAFYDQPAEDFADMMINGISLVQVEGRVRQGWDRVRSADPSVRQQFDSYFGVGQGESVLAAFFLDPNRVTADLERMVNVAEVGAAARRMNIGISQETADRLARLGYQGADALRGFEQIRELDAVWTESVSEQVDLRAETEGVAATFGLDGGAEARQAIERRRAERAAAFGGAGGAAGTQAGFIGLGSAE